MFGLASLMATFAGALAAFIPISAVQPPAPPASIWLSCEWSENIETTILLGQLSNVSRQNLKIDRVYVFIKSENSLAMYQPDSKTLMLERAVIGDRAIMIEDEEQSGSLSFSSKSFRQWSVDRADLSVRVLGSSLVETKMPDGRIMTSSGIRLGSGNCTIIDPLPIAQPKPNAF